MFGHAKGQDVADSINATMEEVGLNKEQFLSMGSDGPNVNKRIWKHLNDHLKNLGFPGLVEFRVCQVAEQLAIDLFCWFKAHPARKEDYFKTQNDPGFDEQLLIRHVNCRWLTLIPALTRIVDNWESIRSYFLNELPKAAREEKREKVLDQNEGFAKPYKGRMSSYRCSSLSV